VDVFLDVTPTATPAPEDSSALVSNAGERQHGALAYMWSNAMLSHFKQPHNLRGTRLDSTIHALGITLNFTHSTKQKGPLALPNFHNLLPLGLAFLQGSQ